MPQNRERVYCVIIRKDMDNGKFEFPEKIPLQISLQDMLEDSVGAKYYLADDKVQDLLTSVPPPCKISRTVRTSGRSSLDRHSWDIIKDAISKIICEERSD